MQGPICTTAYRPGGPQHKKYVELLEQIERRAMKVIKELEHLSCEESLRKLRLCSLEKKRFLRDLIMAYQSPKGCKAGEGLCVRE